MPEGPEVETVRRTLEPSLVGEKLHEPWVSSLSLRNPLNQDDFNCLAGQRIDSINRHGKLLWIDCSSNVRIFVRLGMTGRLTIQSVKSELEKHTHVRLSLKNNQELRYVDPRRFGEFLVSTQKDWAYIEQLGPDPTLKWGIVEQKQVAQAIAKSSRAIKEILLDQSVLAGVGNIYASEALFAARISPFRSGNTLTKTEIKRLLECTQHVLATAVENCGTSFSDYVDGKGNKGRNIHYLKVFMRHGYPCPHCKKTIEKAVQGNRSTYFCAQCQGGSFSQ